MKPVLIIFHVYYLEHIPYYIDKMKNIVDTEWDLIVTGKVQDDRKKELLAFKPGTIFLTTENIGYDIWPFIQAVKFVDLSKYSFVIKLHTKNLDKNQVLRMNGKVMKGAGWRDCMVDALLASPEAFLKVKREFENNRTGLVFSMSTCATSRGCSVEDSSLLTDELERLGITPSDMRFCAGTIFAVRACALSYLKNEKINASVFPKSMASHSDGTITHSYERILGLAVTAQGYRIALIPQSHIQTIYVKGKQTFQPALEWLFSINRFGDHHDKFMTICGKRFKIG